MRERVLTVLAVLLIQSAPAFSADQTIIVIGDSLSSGYGLNAEQSWVDILEYQLEAQAYGYDVVNASIAGDTSSGGLARLPRLLASRQPAIVVIELGGNDGLRGQSIQGLRDNLARMIELVHAHGSRPVLTGIQIPPNYGPAYTDALAAIYRELAQEFMIPFVDFLMEGVALHPELMQGDSIHPNAAGQQIMFENVWAVLAELL
jgi:acyl-CoA thioesterase-1